MWYGKCIKLIKQWVMKKSKTIYLVLITAALASCNRAVYDSGDNDVYNVKRSNTYVRDSTLYYNPLNSYNIYGNNWNYAFRPYYGYYNRRHASTFFHHGYHRPGYYNNTHINNGYHHNPFIMRGGFGHHSSHSISS